MWYKFIKTIYDALNQDSIEHIITSKTAENKAEQMRQRFNKCASDEKGIFHLMGYKDGVKIFKKDFNDSLRSNLNILCKYTGNNESELVRLVNEANRSIISLKQCIFLYFFITENYEINCSYKDFYKKILDAAGIPYSPTIFSNMEEAITYYVLDSEQGSDIWIRLIEDWNKIKNNYERDLEPPVVGTSKKNLSLNLLEELLEQGYEGEEENCRETRRSLQIIKQNIDYIPKEKKGIERIDEIFSKETIKLILDSTVRRQWYFINMIRLIVEKQIGALVNAFEKKDEKEFNHLKSIMWIGREEKDEIIAVKETWSKITVNSNYTPEQIRESLRGSRIIASKISNWLGRMVDSTSMSEVFSENEEIEWLKPFSFEKLEYIKGKYVELKDERLWEKLRRDGYDTVRHSETRISSILQFERNNITRELLLIMTLACKVYGEDSMNIEHVLNNVLYNSRYNDRLRPEANKFDEFYISVFEKLEGDTLCYKDFVKRIMYMQYESEELQEYYFTKANIGVFYQILAGEDVKW